MFGNGIEVHSMLGDFWLRFGWPGLGVPDHGGDRLVAGMESRLRTATMSGLLAFLSIRFFLGSDVQPRGECDESLTLLIPSRRWPRVNAFSDRPAPWWPRAPARTGSAGALRAQRAAVEQITALAGDARAAARRHHPPDRPHTARSRRDEDQHDRDADDDRRVREVDRQRLPTQSLSRRAGDSARLRATPAKRPPRSSRSRRRAGPESRRKSATDTAPSRRPRPASTQAGDRGNEDDRAQVEPARGRRSRTSRCR